MQLLYRSFLIFVMSALSLIYLNGQDSELFPPKPEPAVYVHDYSGWLTPVEKNILEQELRAMNDTTSSQIVLMIRPDIGYYDLSQYAIDLGNKWGIGQGEKDNGIVMLIVTGGSRRGAFISTGYGLEGVLPDALASRIVRNVMIPYFREGHYYEGVSAGVHRVREAVAGEYDDDESPVASMAPLLTILLIFLLITIILVIIARRSGGRVISSTGSYDDPYTPDAPRTRRRNSGPIIWGGGWGSGGSSGGWGGGSFGGGSFGGGGGGGSW